MADTPVNSVYTELQPVTAYQNSPGFTVLYANEYAGGGPVPMVEDLKEIFNDPDIPLTSTSLKMQIEQLMAGYEDGPWVMENINGTLHIHNLPISAPSYGYLYKSENGELLSATIQTNWVSGNVAGSVSTSIGSDKGTSSVMHVTDPQDDAPGSTDWSSLDIVQPIIDGEKVNFKNFKQWFGSKMSSHFKKYGYSSYGTDWKDYHIDLLIHPERYNIEVNISDEMLESFKDARREYNTYINKEIEYKHNANKRAAFIKSHPTTSIAPSVEGHQISTQIGEEQGSQSLAGAYQTDQEALHNHILQAIENTLKTSSDLDKERYKLLKEVATKVREGTRISALSPSEIEILKTTKLKIQGLKGTMANVREVNDRVLYKRVANGFTTLNLTVEQAYAQSSAKVKKDLNSSETYVGAYMENGKPLYQSSDEYYSTSGGGTVPVTHTSHLYYYTFTHYIVESNGSFVTTIWDYAYLYYSRNRGASTSGRARGNRFSNGSAAIKRKKIELQLQVVGRPNLMANQSLYVGNIGKKYSGIWDVETCIHRLSPSSGYTCSLTLVRANGYSPGVKSTSSSEHIQQGTGEGNNSKSPKSSASPGEFQMYVSGGEYNRLQALWLAAGGKSSPAYEKLTKQIIWRNEIYGKDGWKDHPFYEVRGNFITSDDPNVEKSNVETTKVTPSQQHKELETKYNKDRNTPKKHTRERAKL